MPLTAADLAPIKSMNVRLHDVLTKIVQHVNTWQTQSGVAPMGLLPAPPTIGGLLISAGNGWADVGIVDKGVVQPGIEYFLEWDTSPSFANAHVEHLGASRNKLLNLGNMTVYFRAYSSYRGSAISSIVSYTKPVACGGSSAPVSLVATQGSGTSQTPGVGFGTPPNKTQGAQQVLK